MTQQKKLKEPKHVLVEKDVKEKLDKCGTRDEIYSDIILKLINIHNKLKTDYPSIYTKLNSGLD